MSQEVRNAALKEKTKTLLEGPLKHIRGAALAAALLPLASIAAAPASAQSGCPSGGVCGTIFNDTIANGVRDAGEGGIEGVKVFVCQLCDGTDTVETESGPDGSFSVFVPNGTIAKISVLIPTEMKASPPNGDGNGFVVVTVQAPNRTDFGFVVNPAQPGTGTPGYWKNHPEAWPADGIWIGGQYYLQANAIAWLGKVGKDKTTTMFSSLVSAKLSVAIGNDSSCVKAAIAAADAWMATYGPVGSNVPASSYAWSVGEQTHQTLDAYNNGRLCAPHRN